MEIKPCPNLLCDNKDIGLIELVKEHSNNEDIYYYQCVVCGCVHPKEYPTKKEAIAAWNTRPIEDSLRAEIAELKQEIERYMKNKHLSCTNCNSKRAIKMDDYIEVKKLARFIKRKLDEQVLFGDYDNGYEDALLMIRRNFCKYKEPVKGPLKNKLKKNTKG